MEMTFKTSMAIAIVAIPAVLGAMQPAHADCEMRIDDLGQRILKIDQKSAGSAEVGSSSISNKVVEEKLNDTAGDVMTEARGRDITVNRLATASDFANSATVPDKEFAKSGVVHANPGEVSPAPASDDPLTRAKANWREARELHAGGAENACEEAVDRASAELDKIAQYPSPTNRHAPSG